MKETELQQLFGRLALQNEPMLLLRTVEQSPTMIVITDPDGKIIYVNRKFTEITGYSANETVGTAARILERSEVVDSVAMWERLNGGQQWQGEFRYRKKNGDSFWVLASISPVLDQCRRISHFLIIKEDITERKKIEGALERTVAEATQLAANMEFLNAELKATQSQMLQSEKMASIGQLAAGVAHEINNPIGFVSSNLRSLNKYITKLKDYLAVLEQKVQTEIPEAWQDMRRERKRKKIDFVLEDCGDLIAESLEGSERVRKIVQNLKTFSRVDQAGEQLADVNECLNSTITMVWNEIKYKAALEKDFAELPDLYCKPQELSQVFTNILLNAVQAIDEKGLIRVVTREKEGNIVVAISDNGIGIPENIRSRIFEPFFTTKDVGKGTGLGMSISYETVKRHRGEIRVDSELGQGTTFTIVLPLDRSGEG